MELVRTFQVRRMNVDANRRYRRFAPQPPANGCKLFEFEQTSTYETSLASIVTLVLSRREMGQPALALLAAVSKAC